jgi:hypothetical protein
LDVSSKQCVGRLDECRFQEIGRAIRSARDFEVDSCLNLAPRSYVVIGGQAGGSLQRRSGCGVSPLLACCTCGVLKGLRHRFVGAQGCLSQMPRAPLRRLVHRKHTVRLTALSRRRCFKGHRTHERMSKSEKAFVDRDKSGAFSLFE